MAVKFTAIKCPECGANLDIEEGRKQIFCSYCGTKIIMTNENEHIYRFVEEADVKKAENDYNVQMKKMEIIERKRAASEKARRTKVILTVILSVFAILFIGIGFGGDNIGFSMPGLVCCYILMFMWIIDKKEDDIDLDFGDKARVPSTINNYESKSHEAIESMFKNAGLMNMGLQIWI